MAFPGGSVLKNPPDKKEIEVQSLGWEDPLEKEMATHSTVFAREIPRREESGELWSMALQRVGHDLVTEQQQRESSALHTLSRDPLDEV